MDALNNILLGFSVALAPINLFWCFVGVVLGTVVGVLPGLGTGGHHRHAATAHTQIGSHHRNHRAGGHFLRSSLRRFDDVHTSQYAWGIVVGCDLSRRLPNGAQRSSRRRVGYFRHSFFYCRDRWRVGTDADLPTLGTLRVAFRAAGIFRSDDLGFGDGCVSRRRLDG